MSMKQMSQGMPSRVFEGLADLVASHGQNADEIARRIQLDPQSLHRPDLQVSAHSVNDMLEESAAACNQRFLALELTGLAGNLTDPDRSNPAKHSIKLDRQALADLIK